MSFLERSFVVGLSVVARCWHGVNVLQYFGYGGGL